MAAGAIGTDHGRKEGKKGRDSEIIVYCGVGGYASSWWFILTQVLGYALRDGPLPVAVDRPLPVLDEMGTSLLLTLKFANSYIWGQVLYGPSAKNRVSGRRLSHHLQRECQG